MAVAMMVDNPEGSQATYDSVRERLGLQRPGGGIFHVAGPSPNGGWRVIEVWESEEDAKRFVAERLLPAFEAVGAPSARAVAGPQPHDVKRGRTQARELAGVLGRGSCAWIPGRAGARPATAPA